jgi:hypothetical protein
MGFDSVLDVNSKNYKSKYFEELSGDQPTVNPLKF